MADVSTRRAVASGPARVPDGTPSGAAATLRQAALLALAFALVTGAAELLVVGVHKYLLDRMTRVSPHVVWMAPAADVGAFLLLGAALWAAGRWWRKARSHPALVFAFASLAALALLLMIPGLHPIAVLLLALGVGRVASRLLARRLPATLRASRMLVVVLGGALLALSAWVVGSRRVAEEKALAALPEAAAGTPNVLLLILDTVRAKSLGLYGHGRPTSPVLEALARHGVTFDLAISTSPWTLPSHGSMFTGRFPHELGTGFYTPLDDRFPTLADALAAGGFVTAGFTANLVYTSSVQGVDRGFIHYEDYPVSLGQLILSSSLGRELATSTTLRRALGAHELLNRKTASRVNRDFMAWLDGRRAPEGGEDRRPWFAFLNYFDAHEPYLPPEPFDRAFGPPRPRRGLWHFGGLLAGNEARHPDHFRRTPADVRADLDAYEGAIAYVDHEIGNLLGELRERGTLENTVLVIASDHGEQHGEHGLFYHWNSLYMPLLHVPMLIVAPGRVPAGIRVADPVSLRDLPATVFELAGVERPATFPGASLTRFWTRRAGEGSDAATEDRATGNGRGGAAAGTAGDGGPLLSELEKGPTYSLVTGRYHYIVNGDLSEELYDIVADPDEARNLRGSPAHEAALRELRRTMIRTLDEAARAVRNPPR